MPELPTRLLAEGREPDQQFESAEKLYRRFQPEHLKQGRLDPRAVELPDVSVNRGKYSEPGDVLFSGEGTFDGWGVASCAVGDVPAEIPFRGVLLFTVRVRHVPHRRNYAHSEIQALEGETHLDADGIARMDPEAQLRFRERLSRRMKVTIAPR